jgi:hypothetical protein
MSYKFDDLGSSMQFSCAYRGHGLEKMLAIGSIFLFCAWIFILVMHSEQIFDLPSMDGNQINWPLMIGFGIYNLAIFLYLGIELLWQFIGKEVIILSNDEIILQRQIFGIKLSRRFSAAKLNGLFLSHFRDTNIGLRILMKNRPYGLFYFRQGKIAFNYGKLWPLGGPNTFRFGTGITADEAAQIVTLIHQRFPQYQYHKRK